jgi:hypothetical protein
LEPTGLVLHLDPEHDFDRAKEGVRRPSIARQAEDAFARNADVTENRGAQAGGPILEGLAARSYPVLRM